MDIKYEVQRHSSSYRNRSVIKRCTNMPLVEREKTPAFIYSIVHGVFTIINLVNQ